MGNVVTAAALEAMEKVAEQAASEGSREEVGGIGGAPESLFFSMFKEKKRSNKKRKGEFVEDNDQENGSGESDQENGTDDDDEWDIRVDLARAQQLLDGDSDEEERAFADSVALDMIEDHERHESDKY
jgi:hypothetical protein